MFKPLNPLKSKMESWSSKDALDLDLELFEAAKEMNNNYKEESSDSESEEELAKRNLRPRSNRARSPVRVKKEKKSEVRPEDTKRTITCKSCLIPYTYFTDQVAETPEKCRDCKRKAFLKVLQSAK